ncbi:MAG: site-specific DNA-methyltransferase, partial [Clostridiales bacterium]|nr:site-specific DNA-methyltransferase [Clostridiales bacterium]
MSRVINGDALTELRKLPDESVDMCVTSPPYYGLRDYGVDGQIGLEETPDAYIQDLTKVFHEVRRVLKPQGTLWLNIGDGYCNSNGYARASEQFQREGRNDAPANDRDLTQLHDAGYKTKDLIGIPWMLAFALRNDGWY